MFLFTLLATIQQIFGNLFALLAAVGSFLMLLTVFSEENSHDFGQIKSWGIGGFVLGAIGQISLIVTESSIRNIGIAFPLSIEQVNSLLFISLSFLMLRGWLQSVRYRLN